MPGRDKEEAGVLEGEGLEGVLEAVGVVLHVARHDQAPTIRSPLDPIGAIGGNRWGAFIQMIQKCSLAVIGAIGAFWCLATIKMVFGSVHTGVHGDASKETSS